MKSLAELQAIREKMQNAMNLRADEEKKFRIVVGMATCGIAAGARPVLAAISDEIQKRNLTDKVNVMQTGCIGLCQYEPIVEVYEQGQEKVTYIKMDPEKALEVIERHIAGGHVVDKYSMSSSELK